jgi:hypothetical protein
LRRVAARPSSVRAAEARLRVSWAELFSSSGSWARIRTSRCVHPRRRETARTSEAQHARREAGAFSGSRAAPRQDRRIAIRKLSSGSGSRRAPGSEQVETPPNKIPRNSDRLHAGFTQSLTKRENEPYVNDYIGPSGRGYSPMPSGQRTMSVGRIQGRLTGRARVSVATVSRVVNDKGPVREETQRAHPPDDTRSSARPVPTARRASLIHAQTATRSACSCPTSTASSSPELIRRHRRGPSVGAAYSPAGFQLARRTADEDRDHGPHDGRTRRRPA